MQLSVQAKGLLITTAGVLIISPDTLLVRMLAMDQWAMLCCRGFMVGFGLTLLTLLTHRGGTLKQFRAIGRSGIYIALLFAVSTGCFVSSLYFTSVANTLIIVSASSMFAALYSRIFLKESVPFRTMIAMVIVIGSISYIVSDSIGGSHLLGDALATASSMSMAGAFTITRKSKAQNMIPATALSGFFIGTITFFPADFPAAEPRTIILLALLGLVLIGAFALLTLGPRYITAPEVSLLMPIETVLGPILIWMVLGDVPTQAALIGGAIVITTLTVHSILNIRSQAKPIR